MIYFAHSTIIIYEKGVVSHDKMTVAEFRESNQDLIKRIFDEGLSIMDYELSYDQVSKACLVYLQSKYFPRSVKETEVYQLKKESC